MLILQTQDSSRARSASGTLLPFMQIPGSVHGTPYSVFRLSFKAIFPIIQPSTTKGTTPRAVFAGCYDDARTQTVAAKPHECRHPWAARLGKSVFNRTRSDRLLCHETPKCHASSRVVWGRREPSGEKSGMSSQLAGAPAKARADQRSNLAYRGKRIRPPKNWLIRAKPRQRPPEQTEPTS